MKKEQIENQKRINEKVTQFIEWHNAQQIHPLTSKRLRTCSAIVHDYGKYYILVSYSTPVAAIRKDTREGYDFLRLAFGYTATSAQHIAKFFADYGGCERYTWRNV